MTWLVTGGAGYIGAHVSDAFRAAGLDVVVLDDLSSGHRSFVPDDVPLTVGSVLDTALVTQALQRHAVVGVVHLAGYKYAGESVRRPLHTWEQNVGGTVSLLRAMADVGVTNLVFSSSAAVYGTPSADVVTEGTPTAPESPYGESKLAAEQVIRGRARATADDDAPLRHTSLRYFNVVGSGRPELPDTSPHNLFPLALDALLAGRAPRITGVDHPTPDGTCIRDYVHVADLAASHVAAARALADGRALEPVYNLGSGDGLSVRQVLTTMTEVTGVDVVPEEAPRRPGDPARIVASGELARRDIDWAMRHTLHDMVTSAWAARRAWEPVGRH